MVEEFSVRRGLTIAVVGILLFGSVLLAMGMGAGRLLARITAVSLFEATLLFLATFLFVIYWRHETNAGFIGFVLMLLVMVCWSFGVGWVLERFTPFSLFEGAVLTLGITFIIFYTFFLETYPYHEAIESGELPDWLASDPAIDLTRFVKEGRPATGSVRFHFIVANALYEVLVDSSELVGHMGDAQIRELAIRLAEVASAALRRKPPNTRHFQVTEATLRKQMGRMKQRPYDPPLLALTAKVVNELLMADDELDLVVRLRLWNQPIEAGEE